jgi:hypothetical protein
MDWPFSEAYSVLVRFGRWDEMIAEAPPNPRFKAHRRLSICEGNGACCQEPSCAGGANARATSRSSLENCPRCAGGLQHREGRAAIGALVARACIADAQNETQEAVNLPQQAVVKEDQLGYDEPADWFFPVRHLLGAELLRASRPKEAEAVYRADLKQHPANGGRSPGLALHLMPRRRAAPLPTPSHRWKTPGRNADVKLASSAF